MSIDWSQRKTASQRAAEALKAAQEAARAERDRLLAATDWMVLPDAPLTDAERAEALAYRQALRDAPSEAGFRELRVEVPASLRQRLPEHH